MSVSGIKISDIRSAFLVEIKGSPFRSFLAFLQTIGIFIVVGQFIWTFWNPIPTFLYVPDTLLQLDVNGTFSGDLVIAADTGPSVDKLKVRVYGVSSKGDLKDIRNLNVSGIGSGQANRVAVLNVQSPPTQLLICLQGKNVKGASLKQRLILDQNAATSLTIIKNTMVSYKSVPEADLPTTPTCNVGRDQSSPLNASDGFRSENSKLAELVVL